MHERREDQRRYPTRNAYDRYATERFEGDWRDDDDRRRREEDHEGFFERAADTVASWFTGSEPRDDRRTGDRFGYDTPRDDDRRLTGDWSDDETRSTDRRYDADTRATWSPSGSREAYGRGDRRNGGEAYRTPDRFTRDQPDGREAGREYYNRLNQPLRGSGRYDPWSNSLTDSSEDVSRRNDATNRSAVNVRPGRYSGVGPKGYKRSDERVKDEVCDILERHGAIDASDVEVTVLDGVVTLTGTVPDRPMKRMAESALDNIPGVKDVNNQLRVSPDNDHDTLSGTSTVATTALSGDGVTNRGESGRRTPPVS